MRSKAVGLVLTLGLVGLLGVPAAAADRDGDGLRDRFESRWGVTDPDKRDSDGDGVIDSAENDDGDRLSNLGEQRFGTNPGSRDSDGDGKPDGREDSDGDGRSNAREQDRRPLPKGFRPSLNKARADHPNARARCYVSRGFAEARRCVFGDKRSDTTIALFGDSHALMWLPAFAQVAKREDWKLVTLLKGGCPSVSVGNYGQFLLDGSGSCDGWRANALTWLRRNPPDLVVITNNDGYRIVDRSGDVLPESRRPAAWKKGLSKTLAALPRKSRLLVLGDPPWNTADPVECLKRHKQNMSACATRREAPAEREFELAEREAAAAAGAEFRTLYGKVCAYDPCPLVQGNVLMWRDRGHLTTTFVKKLTPSVQDLLRDVLSGAQEPAETVTEPAVEELPAWLRFPLHQ